MLVENTLTFISAFPALATFQFHKACFALYKLTVVSPPGWSLKSWPTNSNVQHDKHHLSSLPAEDSQSNGEKKAHVFPSTSEENSIWSYNAIRDSHCNNFAIQGWDIWTWREAGNLFRSSTKSSGRCRFFISIVDKRMQTAPLCFVLRAYRTWSMMQPTP